MDEKIQELTRTLYQEGVQKGEAKASEIIRQAELEGERIIAAAQASGEKIIHETKQKAEELRRNIEAEIRLASAQAISVVKDRITNVLLAQDLDREITKGLAHPDLVWDLIQTIVKNWSAQKNDGVSLQVLLPEEKKAEFEKAFREKILNSLSRGISIQYSKNMKSGFQIGPQGSSFKISLSDEDFQEFFKDYLRPRTKAFLFGE